MLTFSSRMCRGHVAFLCRPFNSNRTRRCMAMGPSVCRSLLTCQGTLQLYSILYIIHGKNCKNMGMWHGFSPLVITLVGSDFWIELILYLNAFLGFDMRRSYSHRRLVDRIVILTWTRKLSATFLLLTPCSSTFFKDEMQCNFFDWIHSWQFTLNLPGRFC